MPRHAASLWTTYSFEDTSVLTGLTVGGGGVRYVGSSFADTLNTTEIPSFTLVDLSLRYRLGAISARLQNWDVALNVKNLADKRYVGSCGEPMLLWAWPHRRWHDPGPLLSRRGRATSVTAIPPTAICREIHDLATSHEGTASFAGSIVGPDDLRPTLPADALLGSAHRSVIHDRFAGQFYQFDERATHSIWMKLSTTER